MRRKNVLTINAGPWPLQAYAALARTRIASSLRRWAAKDERQAVLWAPGALGVGAGIYFGLTAQPPFVAGAAALAGFAALVAVAPARLRPIAMAFCLAALGFVAADLRTARVAAPLLERETRIVDVAGRVLSVEDGPEQRRYVIALETIEGLGAADLPARARITWKGAAAPVSPGQRIALRAKLSPPPPPVSPGAFDFARQLYFQRIGAVGFAVTAPEVIAPAALDARQRAAAGVEALRESLSRRITAAAPGDGGAIVAAIVTGRREAISPRAEAALRDAGLAHLLAISGLHMGLATGLVFFAVRFALASLPAVALTCPIKKWAALAALLAGAFYLLLSGGGWSAQRAFIMAAIMFAAILCDRRALSLRNVAIAAALILLYAPEALFSPGFQMSFAAVTALIAAYEWMSGRDDTNEPRTLFVRIRRYAVALAATDVIAALATAPYALYHFNRAALYSLPANMAAMPLMGFCIVPACVAGLLLAPFGLDPIAWRAAALFMESVLWVASHVSALPGAVSLTPAWPLSAMLALTLGGLWLCLMRAPWRLAGLAALPLAAALVLGAEAPALMVTPTGRNAAVLADYDGARRLFVYHPRREKFASAMWTEDAGLDPNQVAPAPLSDLFACDASGCAGRAGGGKGAMVSVISDPAALAEDCARADIVIALFAVSGRDWKACRAVLIDRRSVWRRGAHAVWISDDGTLLVRTVRETRGERPWAVY